MKPEFLCYLRCPKTGSPLTLEITEEQNGRIKTGILRNVTGESWPIIDFVPRFVEQGNYADNFGLEWKIHARTQFDADAGHQMSEERVFGVTGWNRNLEGEVILEAGSGSGRFTEHLLGTGAMVISFDYSDAVASNQANNGSHENLLLLQANIYEIPLEKSFFDKVFCFGVLQHTPDPEASFNSLVRMIKPGGKIATDVYLKTVMRYYLNTRYWVRPFTRKVKPQKLYNWCKSYINFMWPLARLVRKIPRVGEALNWRLLIADYAMQMPDADDATLKEWALLDTFDMLSPAFDIPQTPRTYQRWHEAACLKNISVRRGPNGLVATAQAPASSPDDDTAKKA